jgi:hypothetical protein
VIEGPHQGDLLGIGTFRFYMTYIIEIKTCFQLNGLSEKAGITTLPTIEIWGYEGVSRGCPLQGDGFLKKSKNALKFLDDCADIELDIVVRKANLSKEWDAKLPALYMGSGVAQRM